jgi:hypothetical protein
MIALDALLPSKKVPDGAMTSRKFHQIKASIQEVGLIEPLSVSRPDAFKDEFLLVDGHMVKAFEQASGCGIPYKIGPRRAGDIAQPRLSPVWPTCCSAGNPGEGWIRCAPMPGAGNSSAIGTAGESEPPYRQGRLLFRELPAPNGFSAVIQYRPPDF